MNDKVLMIAAVAATAVICIAGMHLFYGTDVQKQDLNIVLENGIDISFDEFTEYSKMNLKVSSEPSPQIGLLEGKTNVIVTTENLTVPDDVRKEKKGELYVYSMKGDAAANHFVNWLI